MAKSRSKRKNPRSNHPQAINSQPIQNYIDKAVQQNLNINVIPSELDFAKGSRLRGKGYAIPRK